GSSTVLALAPRAGSTLVVAGAETPVMEIQKEHEGSFWSWPDAWSGDALVRIRSRGRESPLVWNPKGAKALWSGSTGGTPWSWGMLTGAGRSPLAKPRGVTAHGLHILILLYHGFREGCVMGAATHARMRNSESHFPLYHKRTRDAFSASRVGPQV